MVSPRWQDINMVLILFVLFFIALAIAWTGKNGLASSLVLLGLFMGSSWLIHLITEPLKIQL